MTRRNSKDIYEGPNRRVAERRQSERRKSERMKRLVQYLVIIAIAVFIAKILHW